MLESPENATSPMVMVETEICKCLQSDSPEQAIIRLYDFGSEDTRYTLFLALMMRVTTADKIAKSKERRRLATAPCVDPRNKSEGDGLDIGRDGSGDSFDTVRLRP